VEPNPYESPKAEDGALDVPRPVRFSQTAIAAGQVATGFAAGFALWAVTAPREAWDANPYYSIFVLLAGLVASLARPRGFLWGIVGVYLGQVVAIHLLVPAGGVPIVPPSVGVLFCGTLPAAIGAALGGGIGYGIRRVRKAVMRGEGGLELGDRTRGSGTKFGPG
jgi:hypothetical protein